MPRKKRQSPQDKIEANIRRASSIGDLERLVGLGNAPEKRTAFWLPFSHMPGIEGLTAGTKDLKRRIRAQAVASTPTSGRDGGQHG
jgi:hypothetical protein